NRLAASLAPDAVATLGGHSSVFIIKPWVGQENCRPRKSKVRPRQIIPDDDTKAQIRCFRRITSPPPLKIWFSVGLDQKSTKEI
ncbi:MAG: hypothetical protein V1897_02535, partial [Pseudomonadota bacterium]